METRKPWRLGIALLGLPVLVMVAAAAICDPLTSPSASTLPCYNASLEAMQNPTILNNSYQQRVCGNVNLKNLFAVDTMDEERKDNICAAIDLGSKVAPKLVQAAIPKVSLEWLDFAFDVVGHTCKAYLPVLNNMINSLVPSSEGGSR
jgi:hypothetical protein